MVTNYYNSSNNFSAPIRREPKPYCPKNDILEDRKEVRCGKKNIFSTLDTDTVVILGLLFLLLMSDCNDTLLLIALGYILLF
ncbi:MAG: hypothetical protein IKU15_06435 [Clostridia bacterium]|nr:hypothetical protein [Clostridia bacterium]